MTLNSPYIVQLPKISDPRGNLSFIQDFSDIPFKIKRAYWIYDVPGGEVRHGHAFRKNIELIVALSGSLDVVVTSPEGVETNFHLCRGYYGLLVPPGNWRRLDNFSTNAVAFVLSSELYDEGDYVRDFKEYAENDMLPAVEGAAGTVSYPMNEEDPHRTSSLDDCMIIALPKIRHKNGALSVVQNSGDTLINIARAFYLYDVPGDSSRGGHSHFNAKEFIIAASGCFDVTLSDGVDKKVFTLRRPSQALYIPAGIWRSLDNFSSGSVSLVLTTHPYAEEDYVRNIEEFKQRTSSKRL